jgi:hypothetical protein
VPSPASSVPSDQARRAKLDPAQAARERQQEFLSQVRRLYPGRVVPIADGSLSVTVYPVGIRHIERFARVASAAAGSVAQAIASGSIELPGVGAPEGARAVAKASAFMSVLMGTFLREGLSIVSECCDVDVGELPHWDLAPVVSEWIDLNFGEESKVRPWVRAIETILEKTTGSPVDLWSTVSRSWSPAAIARVKSSIAASLGGRTEAGPSSSSSPDSSQPTDSSADAGQTSSPTSVSPSPQGPTAESLTSA